MPLKVVTSVPDVSVWNSRPRPAFKTTAIDEPLLEFERHCTPSSKDSTWHGLVVFWAKKRLPFLQWLPNYSVSENLLSDIIGGSTIGMVCLAQTLAHATIATTKPIQGPYCAFVPAMVYAFMGTSPHASVSSGAIAAIIIADQLKPWPNIDDRTQLASVLCLVSGITLVLIGMCKLSFAVRFLSQPTISGFVTGGSLLIVVQQFKNLCGFYSPVDCGQIVDLALDKGKDATCHPFPHTDHFIHLVAAFIKFMPEASWLSIALGLMLMGVLELFNRLKTRAKAAIQRGANWGFYAKRISEMKEIVVVIISAMFGYLTRTQQGHPILLTVGHIPAGLPPYMAPWDVPAFKGLMRNEVPLGKAGSSDWVKSEGLLKHFITGGALVAFTTFLTTFATAKKMALKNGYPLDPAQEMIGLGCAGIGGSFFGAFPPSGSLSRTGLADDCGVKTQVGGIFCAAVIGLGLMYLTPVLAFLPKTTLAAIIITSTKSLIDFSTPRKLLKFWRPTAKGGLRRDFIVWCIAFLFTVFLGVLEGIAIACLFSVILIVYDAAAPDAVVLGKVEGELGIKWRNVKDWPNAKQYPGIFVFDFRGPLSFASAEWFEERIEKKRRDIEKSTSVPIKFIIINFQSVHRLDSTAITILEELFNTWKKEGVECLISNAKAAVRLLIEQEFARRAKLVDQTAFMLTINDAVDLARERLHLQQDPPR